MISTHILYLTLPNVLCLEHRFSGVKSEKNNFNLSNAKHVEQKNAVPIEKKMLDSSLIVSPVKAHQNCHEQHASLPNCQHVHLHFNGTRGDTRVKWQMPCMTIILLMIVIVLILNCFHNNYEMGMNYKAIEDEPPSGDEIVMNRRNYRTEYLSDVESARKLCKSDSLVNGD